MILAVIITELKLSNIQLQILFANLMECADNAPFNHRPKAINGAGMDSPANIFAKFEFSLMNMAFARGS